MLQAFRQGFARKSSEGLSVSSKLQRLELALDGCATDGLAVALAASLRLLEEHEQKIGALRQALIDGESSGDAGELNMDDIKSKARRQAQQIF
ncbi:hypothetical protein BH24PSE2_BH24PSE2_19990 [soil metagenome]